MRRALRVVFLVLAGAWSVAGHSQVLLDTALTLGKEPQPVVLPLTIPADGTYRVTLTDFGTPGGAPPRLARLDVGVTAGSALTTSASMTSTNVTGVVTKNFAATAGAHRLTVIGLPNAQGRVGSAGIRIDDPAGGGVLLDTVQAFQIPPPPAASPATFQHLVSLPAAGAYTVTSADFGLPQPLQTFETTVVRESDQAVVADVPGPGPVQIPINAAGPEDYDVIIYAALAAAAPHGLVGVSVRDSASGDKVFGQVDEIGDWPLKYPFDVPATTTLAVTLTDFGFPSPLAAFGAVLARDDGLPARLQSGSGSFVVGAGAGSYVLYADATAPGGASGSFGLQVTDQTTTDRLVDTVQSVVPPGPATDAGAIDLGFDIATAGDYTLTLTDFGAGGFFDAFTSIDLALTDDTQIVNTLNAAGSFMFTAVPGHYSIAVLADPAGTAGQGLLGVQVRGGPSNAVVYEDTEAVGTGFISQTIDVAATQSVDVALKDLAFPASFDALKVAVTRGADRVGEIVGTGQFSFDATPGKYFVNLLATPSTALGYSTLGLTASVTPPVPTVTLTAAASSVQVGNNVMLNWSSTDASACNASGGWTGSRGPSGSESVGPLNTDATFVLTCTGAGGSGQASVTVTVTSQQTHHGGGASDGLTLVGLLGLWLAQRRRHGRGASTA
jgi:hypothetical protein